MRIGVGVLALLTGGGCFTDIDLGRLDSGSAIRAADPNCSGDDCDPEEVKASSRDGDTSLGSDDSRPKKPDPDDLSRRDSGPFDAGSPADPSDSGIVRTPDASVTPCPTDTVEIAISKRYCVDRTEVTNAAYARFVDAAISPDKLPALCLPHTSFLPQGKWPVDPSEVNLPVVGIDWCDALTYCSWAGKSLCSGQKEVPEDWIGACSQNSARAYPYGPDYHKASCNGSDNDNQPADVGSMKTCEGGYPGLLDMSGNVEEWQGTCLQNTGFEVLCAVAGGSFNSAARDLTCKSVQLDRIRHTADDRGFRCCTYP